jgi:hypothetical protein
MDLEMIEYYHDRGLMPDWAYYQQNGKSVEENWIEQQKKIEQKYLEKQRETQQQKALEEYIGEMTEEQLGKCLDDLFKDFAN